jgi:hypothetical protein
MKRILLLATAFLFTIADPFVRADVITAAQASQHMGEVQTVRGVVASATHAARAKGQPTFLNLDKPYPDAILTVVIWGSDRGNFAVPPEKAFKGKTVRVTGKITVYRGTPEIVVHDPTQIIVDESPQRLSEDATPINPPSGTVAKGPETMPSTDAAFDPSTVRMNGTMPAYQPDHFVEAAVYTDGKGVRAIYLGGDPQLLTSWKELK